MVADDRIETLPRVLTIILHSTSLNRVDIDRDRAYGSRTNRRIFTGHNYGLRDLWESHIDDKSFLRVSYQRATIDQPYVFDHAIDNVFESILFVVHANLIFNVALKRKASNSRANSCGNAPGNL